MPEESTIPDPPPAGAETVDVGEPATLRPRHLDPEHVGPYRIIERIGEGGMGLVYKAEQRQPVRRVVALKVIRVGMDTEEVVARFEAERQALALMNHPNVAKVYEAGMTETGRPFFAMEFVPGVPLTKYCDDNKLTTRQRLELFIPVCQAVQHAHQKGIIHRDLKPTNILVTLFDGKPVPKVIDFGIAKATNQQLTQKTLFTQTGALIGTPEYMSPEQAMTSGLDVDTRTDVYSLGVILFELLTGTVPFDAKALRNAGLEGMARIIRETEPPKPSTRLSTVLEQTTTSEPAAAAPPRTRMDPKTLRREIRGDLDWITLKAMEKDRTRRYESAGALADDVRRHLDSEPVLARPPSTTYRVGKFVRKHRIGVAAASAVAAALVVGVGTATLGWLKAVEQSHIAGRERVAAEQARAAAEHARDQAREANGFLGDLFMSFGDVPAARVRLQAAAKRLDEGWLKDDLETHVATRIALGYFLFYAFRDPVTAERQFVASLDLIRRPGGTYPPRASGAIRAGLGGIFAEANQWDKAERCMREAITDYRKVSETSNELVEALEMLAKIREAQEDAKEAAKLRLEAVTVTVAGKSADIAARPADAAAVFDRANANLRLGRFQEALADLVNATGLDPGDHWAWYHRSCVHLYLGDEPAYRAAAAEMLKRFGADPRRERRERSAKVCLLASRPVGDLATLARLADEGVAPGAPPALLPWFRMCKGMAEYRGGKYAEALDSLQRARGVDNSYGQAGIELLMAMCHQGLGDGEKARDFLRRATVRLDEQLPRPGEDDIGSSPEIFLIAVILRREAEKVVGTK